MMDYATVDLDREVAEQARAILAALPGVSVRVFDGPSRLAVGDRTYPLALVVGARRPFTTATAPILAAMAGRHAEIGFVVADRLPEHVRRELVKADCAYADATGAAHIAVPGFFLHTEGQRVPPRTVTAAPPGIGVTGVRVIQVLLSDARRQWSVADLAREAACSAGEAHRILTRLERDGFLAAHGRARMLRRTVTDPGALLDWLAKVPSARRIRERLPAFLYASDPDGLVAAMAARSSETGLACAFSGTAAARLYGVAVATAMSVATIRVSPEVRLGEACATLQADPADRGANVALISDLGAVGMHARLHRGPFLVTPPVRTWLDMLGEPRGEDAAALFRQEVIGW